MSQRPSRHTTRKAVPDGELIAVCSEFARLERRRRHIHNVQFAHDDAAGDAAAEPLDAQMEELLGRMREMRATTLEGFKARAEAIAAYSGDMLFGEGAGWDNMMISALIRDMTAGAVA